MPKETAKNLGPIVQVTRDNKFNHGCAKCGGEGVAPRGQLAHCTRSQTKYPSTKVTRLHFIKCFMYVA